jgi:hypothetical protein
MLSTWMVSPFTIGPAPWPGDPPVGHSGHGNTRAPLPPLPGRNAGHRSKPVAARFAPSPPATVCRASGAWRLGVENPKLLVLPLEAGREGTSIEDPWVLARELDSPCYIGGWTTAEPWGSRSNSSGPPSSSRPPTSAARGRRSSEPGFTSRDPGHRRARPHQHAPGADRARAW